MEYPLCVYKGERQNRENFGSLYRENRQSTETLSMPFLSMKRGVIILPFFHRETNETVKILAMDDCLYTIPFRLCLFSFSFVEREQNISLLQRERLYSRLFLYREKIQNDVYFPFVFCNESNDNIHSQSRDRERVSAALFLLQRDEENLHSLYRDQRATLCIILFTCIERTEQNRTSSCLQRRERDREKRLCLLFSRLQKE